MRTTLILSGAALLVGVICFAADEKVVPKRAEKASAPPAAKTVEKTIEKTPGIQPVSENQSADEIAIRLTDESFVKAYGKANAKAVAAHFTADAEYVDELGNVSQGREAIEESLRDFFAEHPACKLEMNRIVLMFISSLQAGCSAKKSRNDSSMASRP